MLDFITYCLLLCSYCSVFNIRVAHIDFPILSFYRGLEQHRNSLQDHRFKILFQQPLSQLLALDQ